MQNIQSITNSKASGTSTVVDKSSRLMSFITGLDPTIYYPLNETSGNAINRAPSTFGTLNGTVTGATQGAAGKVGTAYSFGGDGDRVVITGFVPTTTFSFFWGFYRNGAPDANDRIIDQASGGPTRGWNVVMAADGTATFQTWNNGGVQLNLSLGSLGNNQWVTISGSIGASSSKVYLNGVEVASGAGNSFGSGVVADLQLMTRSGGTSNPANGSMQHFTVKNNVEWSPAIHSQIASFF